MDFDLPSGIGSDNKSDPHDASLPPSIWSDNRSDRQDVELPSSIGSLPPDHDESNGVSDCLQEHSIPSDTDELMMASSLDGLPSPIHELSADEKDMVNAFDEVSDPMDDELQLLNDAPGAPSDSSVVPSPLVARLLTRPQDFAEYYSPRRVAEHVERRGKTAVLSLDLLTGWDFQEDWQRQVSECILRSIRVRFLLLCPPCTVFSDLQRLFNIKRLPPDVWKSRWQQGMTYLEHSMRCAVIQVQAGQWFMFEHPSRATSWTQECVQRVHDLPGVTTVDLDLCMVGLRSKVNGIPMRKRTRIMTNSIPLIECLSGRLCTGQHDHQTIQGSEGGLFRSVWAQIYPVEFVELVASAVIAHCK